MRVFDICDFGASPGKDSTEAIQKALCAAGEVGGTVLIPGGKYLTGKLTVPANIHVEGVNGWTADEDLGSVLVFNGDGDCLLDLSAARGTTVNALALDGCGKDACGVKAHAEGTEKTSFFLEAIKVHGFAKSGFCFKNVIEGTIRHSLAADNGKYGICLCGTDLTVTDSRAYRNGGGLHIHSAERVSVTSCRFSENKEDGCLVDPSDALQFTGNSFDCNGGVGLYLHGTPERLLRSLTVTACRFYSNAKEHLTAEYLYGATICANLFSKGDVLPTNAAGFDHLWDAVFRSNQMSESSRLDSIRDNDNHRGKVLISANMGY